jgi:hypothetical protein
VGDLVLGTQEQRQSALEFLTKAKGREMAVWSDSWREMEVDNVIRQWEAKERGAATQVIAMPTTPYAQTAPVSDVSGHEWSGNPCDGLKSAQADLAQAEMERDEAGEHCDRALRRVASAEEDIAQYEGLESKIDAWNISQVRSGANAEMPYALANASRQRTAAVEKHQQSTRARNRLANELRDRERRVQQCQHEVSVWAQRVLIEQAEERAEALERLMATADDIRAELDALAQCSFPNAGGICQVSPLILRALNLVSKPRDQLTALELQPLKERWQEQHEKLLQE